MKKLATGLMLVTMLLGALAPAGCIFDTRDPAPPEDDSGDTVILDSPQKVFLALEQSLANQKDANYERATSTAFLFSPTLADSLDQNFLGTGVYDNWNKDVEMDVLGLLLSDTDETVVDFGDPSVLIQNNTFVRFGVTYRLDVVETATPTDTTTYKGVAQIDVRLESGNWRMTFWNEVETVEGASTWGFLRGILRLRLNP